MPDLVFLICGLELVNDNAVPFSAHVAMSTFWIAAMIIGLATYSSQIFRLATNNMGNPVTDDSAASNTGITIGFVALTRLGLLSSACNDKLINMEAT